MTLPMLMRWSATLSESEVIDRNSDPTSRVQMPSLSLLTWLSAISAVRASTWSSTS